MATDYGIEDTEYIYIYTVKKLILYLLGDKRCSNLSIFGDYIRHLCETSLYDLKNITKLCPGLNFSLSDCTCTLYPLGPTTRSCYSHTYPSTDMCLPTDRNWSHQKLPPVPSDLPAACSSEPPVLSCIIRDQTFCSAASHMWNSIAQTLDS